MIITSWILLVLFGVFSLQTSLKFLLGGTVSLVHGIFWFVAIVITALSAGVIWGGLFQ